MFVVLGVAFMIDLLPKVKRGPKDLPMEEQGVSQIIYSSARK